MRIKKILKIKLYAHVFSALCLCLALNFFISAIGVAMTLLWELYHAPVAISWHSNSGCGIYVDNKPEWTLVHNFLGGNFNFFTLTFLLQLAYSNGNSYKWKEKLTQYIYYQEAFDKRLKVFCNVLVKINHASKLNLKSTYCKLKLPRNNNQLSLFGSFKRVT